MSTVDTVFPDNIPTFSSTAVRIRNLQWPTYRQQHILFPLPAGYDIPSGCTVIMHIYRVHRNPVQYPNPEKFDPDNFLPERVAKRHPYAYIPFSAGPRNCIGQKFAMLELKTVLSYMLRHYRLRSLDTREKVNLLLEFTMKPEGGINLTITPRETRNDSI